MRDETHPIPKGNITSCALRYQVYDLCLWFLWVSQSIRDMNDDLANIKE